MAILSATLATARSTSRRMSRESISILQEPLKTLSVILCCLQQLLLGLYPWLLCGFLVLVVFYLVVGGAHPLLQFAPIYLICSLCDEVVSSTLLHHLPTSQVLELDDLFELFGNFWVPLHEIIVHLDSS